MKIRGFVIAAIFLFVVQGFAFADRQLDSAEIVQIFQTLTTSQARDTWIPAGTIEATHQAYKSSDGSVIDSSVIVKYDGDKFYWEINIDSSTIPKGNSDGLDRNNNARRIFAWDGNRYTMYFKSGNHAVVTERAGNIPIYVNGPLTAGIVPWGRGIYTLEGLLAAESSAVETDVSGKKQVHLTLLKETNGLSLEIVFVLDASKDYTLLSWSLNNIGYTSIVKTYEDYQLMSGIWIPTTIIIERHDNTKQQPELLSYDNWNIISTNVDVPPLASFAISYETDTLVEYDSSITSTPLLYYHSDEVDTDSLLHEKFAIVATSDPRIQNCATVAMKYVSAKLGHDVNDQQLSQLVNVPNKNTSLYTLRQFAQQLGFYCLAVKTDFQTLKDLEGTQAILHIPETNHYVVLGTIDDKHIGIIDLNSNKFYQRTGLDTFKSSWSEGTVLLISKTPLLLSENFTQISDENLHEIIGSDGGGFGFYSCSDLIQVYNITFCSEPLFMMCGSRYRIFYNRYGCEPDENGGNCSGTSMVGSVSSPCIEDPFDPGTCALSGDWYPQHIRACQ